MSLHTLQFETVLPVSMEEAWDFFTSPLNLKRITPPEMDFKVLSGFKEGDRVKEGMIINYRVRPLFGIPVIWQSEITSVKEHQLFADEQRKGPYAYWKHEHRFREANGQVEMTDVVRYRLPLGLLGDFMNRILVRRKLLEIFEFRSRTLQEIFKATEAQ